MSKKLTPPTISEPKSLIPPRIRRMIGEAAPLDMQIKDLTARLDIIKGQLTDWAFENPDIVANLGSTAITGTAELLTTDTATDKVTPQLKIKVTRVYNKISPSHLQDYLKKRGQEALFPSLVTVSMTQIKAAITLKQLLQEDVDTMQGPQIGTTYAFTFSYGK